MDWRRFLDHQTKTITQAGSILAFSAFLSRVLGVVRDWLLAQRFGASPELDVYFTAFKIPDFVYNILILGGVLVAFLPIFSELHSKDSKKAWRFASNALNIFFLMLVLLSLVLFLFTPRLLDVIAPGFSIQQKQEAVLLTRIMFLSPIFFGLSAIFSGILQYFNRFLVYSLCPLLYNLGIIFGILFLAPHWGILGVTFGVVGGAFLHFIIQVPSALKCGFSYQPVIDLKDSRIKKAFFLMVPRTFGVAASQINLIAMNAIASTLAVGSVSIFNFANNIQYFPIGIVGASFAMAAFPVLSKKWAERKEQEFTDRFSSVFRQVVYLIVPVSILIFILREEIITVLLRHGEFSALSARLTSSSLAFFCLGIFASALIPLLFRAFFSLKDTKTPTLIAFFSVLVNIALSVYFTDLFKNPQSCIQKGAVVILWSAFSFPPWTDISVLGLPLAVSISAILQFLLMFAFLAVKIKYLKMGEILKSAIKVLVASFFSGVIASAASLFLPHFVDSGRLIGAVIRILIIGFLGGSSYLVITYFLRSPEIEKVRSLIFKRVKE
ncbi:MAG: murein biosynthesis integral membrane protein MurJ [Candidatus Nealsonbacteria bacterium]|nr:murein biosynthesis integral membrane protein MurJ [Candidatus Nealsonbacteria bacterium]